MLCHSRLLDHHHSEQTFDVKPFSGTLFRGTRWAQVYPSLQLARLHQSLQGREVPFEFAPANDREERVADLEEVA